MKENVFPDRNRTSIPFSQTIFKAKWPNNLGTLRFKKKKYFTDENRDSFPFGKQIFWNRISLYVDHLRLISLFKITELSTQARISTRYKVYVNNK